MISAVVKESDEIRSFYLTHKQGLKLPPFKAGQHLTVKIPNNEAPQKSLIRAYTVSSSPENDFYRLSIKHQEQGAVSSHFHNHLAQGDEILAKYPQGEFYIEANSQKPAVLLAGGIGITPMISMVKHLKSEALKTGFMRTVTVFHSAKTAQQRAFYEDLKALAKKIAIM
ncbi:FAD-binding oxidoreductase [Pseudoalteromonas espejiana]